MADFYFFTDPQTLISQTSDQAFGPVLNGDNALEVGKDKYRLTDVHKGNNSPVFAICDGIVCLQPDGPTTLSIILKPSYQPPFDFPYIKYIIYKGVKKSTFVNSNNEIVQSADNDLASRVHSNWLSINDNDISDSGDALGLGYDSSVVFGYNSVLTNIFESTESIDNFFYYPDSQIQLPLVKAGEKMGFFDTKFGVEIITESIGFNPPIDLCRNLENFINVDSISDPLNNSGSWEIDDADFFEHWHKKEICLNFLDPTAFWGSFYHGKLNINSASVSPLKISDIDIYYKVLLGEHYSNLTDNNYYNKNKSYLDIRNDYNQSFNYLKNYGNDIQISFDNGGSLTSHNYYKSGWPILVLENANFPNTNSTIVNEYSISLPQSDNTHPFVYFNHGFRDLKSNSFKKVKTRKRFIELDYSSIKFYTNDILISIPNDGTSNNTLVVSSLTKLTYYRRPLADAPSIDTPFRNIIHRKNSLDNLFAPFSMDPPFLADSKISFKIYEDVHLVDKPNGRDLYTVNVGVVKDVHTITLVAKAIEIRKKLGMTRSKPIPIVSSQIDKYDYFVDYLNNEIFNLVLSTSTINLQSGNIDTASFSKNEILNFDIQQVNKYDSDELILLMFNLNEFNTTSSLVSGSNMLLDHKVFLGVGEIIMEKDDNQKDYIMFDLVLKGFSINGSKIEVIEIPANTKMYNNGDI